jgi:hypothetical protein
MTDLITAVSVSLRDAASSGFILGQGRKPVIIEGVLYQPEREGWSHRWSATQHRPRSFAVLVVDCTWDAMYRIPEARDAEDRLFHQQIPAVRAPSELRRAVVVAWIPASAWVAQIEQVIDAQ